MSSGWKFAVQGLCRGAVMLVLAGSASAQAVPPLPELIWPLCGRLGEQPADWQPGQPCPNAQADPDRHDLPIHNGYGLRNFVVASRPTSFHRGIDLATRASTFNNGYVGNPVFAVCDGYIKRILGTEPDQTLELVCPQDGVPMDATAASLCTADNPCITAAYRHVQALLVVQDELVARGDHLGFSGSTAPGGAVFEHLHFEFHDPRARPSSTDHGRTSFSKDTVNPLRYLPLVLDAGVPVAVELDASGLFDGYTGAAPPALVLRLTAEAGFQHDFAGLDVEVFVPGDGDGPWQRRGKDLALIQGETGTAALTEFSAELGLAYPFADGDGFVSRHRPEQASRFYTPFSENSSRWQHERELTWYRVLFGDAHPGIDGLLERNADGELTDGHLTQDFDFRLIRANANPSQPIDGPNDPAAWWGLRIGLREYGALAPPYCVMATVAMLPDPADGSARAATTWLANPSELDCSPAEDLLRIFRDGFEPLPGN